MLERTAASLEPCSFQRIVPSTKKTHFKSSRRLHSAFWQHGAAEIELSRVWQTLIREPLESLSLQQTSNKPESLRASTVLLDFLYPPGAVSFARRSSLPPVFDVSRVYLRGTVPRLFTSSAIDRQKSTPNDSDDAVTTGPDGPSQSGQQSTMTNHYQELVMGTGGQVATLTATNAPESTHDSSKISDVAEGASDHNDQFRDSRECPVMTSDISGSTTDDQLRDGREFTTTIEADLDSKDCQRPITTNKDMDEDVSRQISEPQRDLDSIPKTVDVPKSKSGPPTNDGPAEEAFVKHDQLHDSQKVLVETDQAATMTTADTSGSTSGTSNDDSTRLSRDDHLRYSQASIPKKRRGAEYLMIKRAIKKFENALMKLRQIHPMEHGQELENIWSAYHNIEVPEQDDFDKQFFDYITKHRTEFQIVALALQRDKPRFLVKAWGRLSMPQLFASPSENAEVDTIDWSAFEDIFTIDELGMAISSFIAEMKQQETRTNYVRWPEEIRKSLLRDLIYPLMHRYAEHFPASASSAMLTKLQDKDLYEHFLRIFIEKDNKECADAVYRPYRELVDPMDRSPSIMKNMLHAIYFPENGAGLEMVAQDLEARFGQLAPGQHRRMMTYYARQGDTFKTEQQWNKYEKQMFALNGPSWKPDSDHHRPLLHVYAVRGELNHVRRIFSAIQTKYGPELSTKCWNVLLNAHAKAQDYQGAIRVFTAMRQTVEMDRHSFGTMMGMTGSRGDIEYTLDIYRLAKEQGIQNDAAIIDSVVEAYCQNERMVDAEKICEIATTSGDYEPEHLTTLWNTLLNHLSYQRDLVSMNRILDIMTRNGIPYDGDTYEALLQGLALTRQATHAYHLLREAAQTKSFRPDLRHYALLMGAFIRTKRPQLAYSMSNVLKMFGVQPRGHILVRILQALGNWTTAIGNRDNNRNLTSTRFLLVQALRDFRTSVQRANRPRRNLPEIHGPPAWLSKYRTSIGPDQTLVATSRQARLLCFIFAQMREYATVQDILDMWRESSPQASEMETPPIQLISTLLLAAYSDNKFDDVERFWQLVFKETKRLSQVGAPGTERTTAVPGMRYVLNDSMRIMMRYYGLNLQDHAKLTSVVKDFHDAGFELVSKNWNYYVQMLVRLKQWREAFVICEERLMPQWMGWYAAVPLELRRKRSNPKQPRPISYTMAFLSRAYMDLEQMAVWSVEAERLVLYISQHCPKTVTAVTTELYAHDNPLTTAIMNGRDIPKRPWGTTQHLERIASEISGTGHVTHVPLPKKRKSPAPGEVESLSSDEYESSYVTNEASGEEAKEEDWYDVDSYTEDTWAPMTLNQKVRPLEVPDYRRKQSKAKPQFDQSEPWYDSEGNLVEGTVGPKSGKDEKPSF